MFICMSGEGGLLYICKLLLKLQDSLMKKGAKQRIGFPRRKLEMFSKTRSFRKETDVRENAFSMWPCITQYLVWKTVQLWFPSQQSSRCPVRSFFFFFPFIHACMSVSVSVSVFIYSSHYASLASNLQPSYLSPTTPGLYPALFLILEN